MTPAEKKAAIENYSAAVKRTMDRKSGRSRHQAVEIVAVAYPELHAAFLAATHRGYAAA